MIDDEPGSTQPNTQLPADFGIAEVVDPTTAAASYATAGLSKMAEQAALRETAKAHGYVELDPDDAMLWRRRFSSPSRISDLQHLSTRPDFVAALKRAREQKVFTRIELWAVDINRSRSRELVLVGLIDPDERDITGYYTAHYIIDQHVPKGETATTTEHLRKRYKHFEREISFSAAQPKQARVALGLCLSLLVVTFLEGESWQWALATLIASGVTYGAQFKLTNHEEDFVEELGVCVGLVAIVQVIAFLIGLAL